MRYVVDINQKHASEIEALVKVGAYKDFAQFINVAIENQIFIENQDTTIRKDNIPSIGITPSQWPIGSEPKFVSPANFNQLPYFPSGVEEKDCWLWGQINKIFPVKVALRTLYSELGSNEWIPFEDFSKGAVRLASSLRTNIKKQEEILGKGRDERVSTGLPEENDFNSGQRYKNQFIGYFRSDNKIDGALASLRFANLKKDKDKVYIGITKPGYEFAKLDNPVIRMESFDYSLTEEEINYYIRHIAEYVKGEYNAVIWLLQKLSSGISDREELNNVLKKEYLNKWGEISDAMINTQRAGLMARMYELRLIDKEKNGLNVIYRISEKGKRYI